MSETTEDPIHRGGTLTFLYSVNILCILYVYISFFIQVVELPFQAIKFPDIAGPGWLYLLLVVIAQIEYFMWPLEVLEYMFRTYADQIQLIVDPSNMDRW